MNQPDMDPKATKQAIADDLDDWASEASQSQEEHDEETWLWLLGSSSLLKPENHNLD